MRVISDLHIHSKYSRGCSKDLDIDHLEKYARIKGIHLLGTGDIQHPGWIKEVKEKLTEKEEGIYITKSGFRFILTTEISLIYSQDGKGRRVHLVVFLPDIKTAEQFTDYLKSKGRVDYDGRPIFKIPCDEFTRELKKISDDIEIIPAHIWTPHFSLFGAYSDFNTVEEAFKDQTKNIFAMETGLSSDPKMNWRLSQLDRYNLVSFSDSHSFWPWRLGREATVFELDKNFTYKDIIKAIRTGEGLWGTLEIDPNMGKYHLTGHRNCNVCLQPGESKKIKDICPVCKRPLTIGVEERIEELADREYGSRPDNAKEFRKLIPLSDIIAKILGKGVATKAVSEEYDRLLKAFNDEFNILLDVPEEELLKVASPELVAALMLNREGKIEVKGGYDGVYGVPIITEQDKAEAKKELKKPVAVKKEQTGLGDFI